MDIDKYRRATELFEEIERYKEHRTQLEASNIQYGGDLIFTYNQMHNDVRLKKEIYGDDFFHKYMQALDDKIETLQKEFDKL